MKKILMSMPWDPEVMSNLNDEIKKLTDLGFEVELDRSMKRLTEKDLLTKISGVYAHICGADAWTEKVIEIADELEIISRIGVGYDTVDIKAASMKNIIVTTTPGAGAESVAEYCFALMINMSRNVLLADKQVREGKWVRLVGPSMYRKTLGIIGMGNIGKQLSKIVKGFDMEILAFDEYQDVSFASQHGIKYCKNLEEIFAKSDYISVHVPLTEKTRDLISKKEIQKMKSNVIIVNAARGGIINEKDLYWALKENKIRGACLDVFDSEPINPDNPLLELDNIIVTPHNAGSSIEGKNRVFAAAVQNVIDIYKGKRPSGVINKEVMSQEQS